MPKKKVTSSLKRLVFREKKKAPHLGVRPLSKLLEKKYNITLSKSAINKILSSSGLKEKKGRKSSLLEYQARGVQHCGLFLLRCLDYQIGIFDYLSEELKSYFPKLDKNLLKQLIILSSFSALINEEPGKAARREGFLRLANLSHFPARKFKYFIDRVAEVKPRVGLEAVKENIKLASAIKFYFNNGYHSYFDARMSTFWAGPCDIEHFFLPLRAAVKLIKQMVKNKSIIIGYTKSFGHLSSLTFDFLKAVEKGIKKIEFLDERGKVLSTLEVNLAKVSFFIGYYPRIVTKGISPIGKFRRFKSFFWEEMGEFLCTSTLTRFSQPQANEKLILNNVLIKQAASSSSTWGLLTGNISSNRARTAVFLKKYLSLWPNAEEEFIEDMRIIEKSRLGVHKNRRYLTKMLPNRLFFKEILDFAGVGQILSAMFKEIIWGWEPKNKSGDFVWGKDYLRISLRKIPKQAKKRFNKEHFYLDDRRVFIS